MTAAGDLGEDGLEGAPEVRLPLWVRVGGGLEEVPGGRRHGPADPDLPPPGGPWEELQAGGGLIGWTSPGVPARAAARRAREEAARIVHERRARLLRRLGHKLRSSVLALQESARQAAFGRYELLEQLYDQAQDVGRRALALEAVSLDPTDPPRAVVVGAVVNLAAAGARRTLPPDAVVRASEPVLVEALARACEWMGGQGAAIRAEPLGRWWRLEIRAAPDRRIPAIPELGEPLVRYLVDCQLEGWLDSADSERALIYLPMA